MANREVADHYPAPARTPAARSCCASTASAAAGSATSRSCCIAARSSGIAGLVGAGRTRLARAIVGADPARTRADRRSAAGRRASIRRRDAVRAGIGFLPEDRKQQGLVLGLSRRAERRPVASRRACRGSASSIERRERQRSGGRDRQPAHPHARARTAGAAPERRQSAEGRAGEMAGGAGRGPHLRRADPRHRRRRAGTRSTC